MRTLTGHQVSETSQKKKGPPSKRFRTGRYSPVTNSLSQSSFGLNGVNARAGTATSAASLRPPRLRAVIDSASCQCFANGSSHRGVRCLNYCGGRCIGDPRYGWRGRCLDGSKCGRHILDHWSCCLMGNSRCVIHVFSKRRRWCVRDTRCRIHLCNRGSWCCIGDCRRGYVLDHWRWCRMGNRRYRIHVSTRWRWYCSQARLHARSLELVPHR